jgi:hypothetical protein
MIRLIFTIAFLTLSFTWGQAQDRPTLEIVWPTAGSVIELGSDAEKTVGVVIRSNVALFPPSMCAGDGPCGHIHMKIDPDGDSCNIPGRAYNSMNSDFGGDLIKARFGHCPNARGTHVIGILLADANHKPILVDGRPVTASVTVTTK